MCPGLPDPLARDGGLPVIRPRNDCTPSFTQQDVRDDLAHGVRLIYFEVVGQLTVPRVVFLTSGDLKGIGGPIDTSADTLLCYAELSGMFRDGTTRVPLGTTTTASAAFIVFDAHTGKALVLGLGPGPLRG
jgi:hypothetical protein